MDPKFEYKYDRLRKIGIGSYGVVFKCLNRQTGQFVAIKRYTENDSDPITRKIAMREVRMLRQLKHPNIINLIEIFRRKRRLHLVFDYCELTVLDVIEKYADNCPLNLIKRIVWQLVNAISYCHSHNCIHRDIKPENILLTQSGVVKLCDFGFARSVSSNQGSQGSSSTAPFATSQTGAGPKAVGQQQVANQQGRNSSQPDTNLAPATTTAPVNADQQLRTSTAQQRNQTLERQALTEYVATRWYRAPELLIGDSFYNVKIDIWAIGCVAGELMRGEPVWPGKTDLDQLGQIQRSLGSLTGNQMQTLLSQTIYDKTSIDQVVNSNLQKTPSDPLERKIPTRIGRSGCNFVTLCLQMDPNKRPTSQELLRHAYIYSTRMDQFLVEQSRLQQRRQQQQQQQQQQLASPGQQRQPLAAVAQPNESGWSPPRQPHQSQHQKLAADGLRGSLIPTALPALYSSSSDQTIRQHRTPPTSLTSGDFGRAQQKRKLQPLGSPGEATNADGQRQQHQQQQQQQQQPRSQQPRSLLPVSVGRVGTTVGQSSSSIATSSRKQRKTSDVSSTSETIGQKPPHQQQSEPQNNKRSSNQTASRRVKLAAASNSNATITTMKTEATARGRLPAISAGAKRTAA